MQDAIIIGAGPAGGMAALRLAEASQRVLILEKAVLPRDKACGGGLTPPVAALLDWDFSPLVEAQIRTSRWQFDHGVPLDVSGGESMMMVTRRDFDAHIIERALTVGSSSVALRDGFAVSSVEEDRDGVTVVGPGGERLRASYLIGADGAFGKTAAAVGLGRRTPPGLAIDATVEVTANAWAAERDRSSFNFGCLPGGYGWIFPKGDHLSCGVGSWSGKVPMPAALNDYLARALPVGSIVQQYRRGHPIPLYEGSTQLDTRRVLLAGDAGSLVDPIMGEGIRFAVQSGAIAARVVLDRLARGPDSDHPSYTALIDAAFRRDFERLLRFIQPIFLRKPELFYRRFYVEGANYFALARAMEQHLSGVCHSVSHG